MLGYACRAIVMTMVLLGVLTGWGMAKEKGGVCNSKVAAYLKSAGFSPEEVSRICSEAGISAGASQGETDKCEALARKIEQVWEEGHPAKPMDMMIMKHAVDLACPRVCNADIAKYLKSVGISTQSISGICILAETLVEQDGLARGDALKKALLEKSTTIYQINDQVIREAVQMLKGARGGF